ncbi:MAG: hypothetical protein HDT38_07420 [Clostridiales bacterium]|nr:hypothetical protein [Clostridiales bacterium]
MKHKLLRRLGALALAVVLALSVAVTPAMAAAQTTITGITLSETKLDLAIGARLTLTATAKPSGDAVKVNWVSSDPGVVVVKKSGETVAMAVGKAKITATAVDDEGNPIKDSRGREITAECNVEVREPRHVTKVTLNLTSLRLNPEGTAELTATVDPRDADNKTLVWSCSPAGAVTVEPQGEANARGEVTAKITANDLGRATITVSSAEDPEIKAECSVSVGPKPTGFEAINITTKEEIPSGGTWELGLKRRGDNLRVGVVAKPDVPEPVFTYDSVRWTVKDADGKAEDQSVIRVVKEPASYDPSGCSAVVTAVGPGQAWLTVTSGNAEGEWKVEIPGITLQGNVKTIQNGRLSLWEGEVETLLVTRFGDAKNAGSVIWTCTDESIVTCEQGRLTARTPGTAKVIASLDGYADAEVTVTVQEDTSALIQGLSVTAGGSISMDKISSQLNSIARSKTGGTLSYITSLSVATSQGILHDSHRSEADTGAGVGTADRYYLSGNRTQGRSPLSDLSFVARSDFKGDADISYTGVTTDNQYFNGIIRVSVAGVSDVTYSAVAGQPLSFQSDDFNRICQSKQGGRTLSSVSFTLPQASWGELRYDYSSPTHTGQAVIGNTEYYRSRTPSLDRVSFVPSSSCPSTITIAYRGTDTNGGTYSGRVTINITKQNGGYDSADVHFNGWRGEQVAFNAASFNSACLITTGEALSYVRFSLPSSTEGTMYLNYWGSGSYSGVVSASANYYVSGTPGLGTISFVSTSVAPDQVAIPYTGYSTRGTVYTGTVYINLDDASHTGLRYSIASGRTVNFNVNDFNNACINATGASLDYVRFNSTPSSTQGYLRYYYISGSSYGNVSTSTQCYRVNPSSSSRTVLIGNVYFQANVNYTGTVTLPYTGYATSGAQFTGEVVIQVTPNTITYTGTNANPMQLSASHLTSACSWQMTKPLSYITLDNLPASTAGRLYVGYSKFGTGVAANTGTKYYVSGSPNISQLSFVPRGRYEGQVEVNYTAVSTSNEKVTGKIVFNVVPATGSSYFRDMGNHVWAASAVDYLYQNGVVNGIGNSSFGPGQNIMRRDFMVILDRAFNFPNVGTYSFSDVPTNAYYSKALAAAKQLGIVGSSDNRFQPSVAITREDAMVMIYNTLVAMGKNPPRGSEADLARFTDNQLISSYARSAVSSLVQMGVIRGSNGQLNPKGTITRAEAAMIFHYVLTM